MIAIRPARPDETPWIADCQVRMARETENLALDRATVLRGVAAVFDGRGQYYVAECGSAPAGCMLTLPEWSDWRNGTVLWIHSVYVVPEFRRQGVFRRFYEHLQAMVRADESLKGLRLYVDKTNAAARTTYESLGMDGRHYQLYEWQK